MRRSAATALCAIAAVLALGAVDARKGSILSAREFGRQLLSTCPGGNSVFCQSFFGNCVTYTCNSGILTITLDSDGPAPCKSGTYSW
jgi:hypothetical protein